MGHRNLRSLAYELTDEERSYLSRAISAITPAATDERTLIEAGKGIADSFPEGLSRLLHEMSAPKSDVASVYIRNLPVDCPNGFTKPDYASEILLGMLTRYLGEPMVVPHHRDGALLMNLIPKKADKDKQLGSGTDLEWHSEDAQVHDSAHFICLLGLRADPNAYTFVSNVDVSSLNEPLLASLQSASFSIRTDESYNQAYQQITPAITNDVHDLYHLRYDPSFCEYLTPESEVAGRQLHSLFEQYNDAFCVKTGELLIFNNRIAAHKRSTFVPTYSETDRWVQRIMIV